MATIAHVPPVESQESLPPSLTRWPGYLLAFVAERQSAEFEQRLGDGLRSRHVQVLAVVDAEGPMSQRALGRRLRIDKSIMVGLVDDLEELGHAERRRSTTDRRVQDIHLTRAGTRALKGAIALADELNAQAFDVLDDDETRQLHDLLERVARRVSDAA